MLKVAISGMISLGILFLASCAEEPKFQQQKQLAVSNKDPVRVTVKSNHGKVVETIDGQTDILNQNDQMVYEERAKDVVQRVSANAAIVRDNGLPPYYCSGYNGYAPNFVGAAAKCAPYTTPNPLLDQGPYGSPADRIMLDRAGYKIWRPEQVGVDKDKFSPFREDDDDDE